MKIKKKSWHYWLYCRTYEGKVPASTNLCQYVRRVAISVPYIVLMAALYCAIFIAKTIWNVLDGGIPTSLDIEEEPYIYAPTVKGTTIRPWYIMAPLILVYLYYYYTTIMLWLTAIATLVVIWKMINLESAILVLVVGFSLYLHPVITLIIIGIVIGIIIAIAIATRSDTWNLAREYLKAQKQKICPIVEFQGNQV